MKITVNETKQPEEGTYYPCLMINEYGAISLMFSEIDEYDYLGVCIKSAAGEKDLRSPELLNKMQYKPFHGSVTLENS